MRSARSAIFKSLTGLLALLAALVAPAEAAAAVEPSPASLAALGLLHQGRFEEATRAFSRISRERAEDPEGPLFEALTAWWRLLDLPDDPELRPVLEERLSEAVRRGEALLDGPEAQRGRILAGTAALLAAQTQAFTGSYLAAGRSARDGHELLEEALRRDPRASDARFALGAYKYFAARLPWLVRLVGFFVRLPGGDVEEGLEALADASREGRYFRTESLLLLAYIHSGDDENDLRTALAHLRRARELESGSPLLAAIEARFLFMLGRLDQAEAAAREAIRGSETTPGVAPAVPALARIRLALALYYQYRPDEAARTLAPLAKLREILPEDAVRRMEGLRLRLEKDEGRVALASADDDDDDPVRLAPAAPVPPGHQAARALEAIRSGEPARGAGMLQEILSQGEPADAVARYHLARAFQLAGDQERARQELEALFRSGQRIPKTLRGWAFLRMGAALESAGMEQEARGWYRRAASLNNFVFSRAGRDRIDYPSEPFSPEG